MGNCVLPTRQKDAKEERYFRGQPWVEKDALATWKVSVFNFIWTRLQEKEASLESSKTSSHQDETWSRKWGVIGVSTREKTREIHLRLVGPRREGEIVLLWDRLSWARVWICQVDQEIRLEELDFWTSLCIRNSGLETKLSGKKHIEFLIEYLKNTWQESDVMEVRSSYLKQSRLSAFYKVLCLQELSPKNIPKVSWHNWSDGSCLAHERIFLEDFMVQGIRSYSFLTRKDPITLFIIFIPCLLQNIGWYELYWVENSSWNPLIR